MGLAGDENRGRALTPLLSAVPKERTRPRRRCAEDRRAGCLLSEAAGEVCRDCASLALGGVRNDADVGAVDGDVVLCFRLCNACCFRVKLSYSNRGNCYAVSEPTACDVRRLVCPRAPSGQRPRCRRFRVATARNMMVYCKGTVTPPQQCMRYGDTIKKVTVVPGDGPDGTTAVPRLSLIHI